MNLTYQELRAAVEGSAVGVRARTALEPLGGPGDKTFPPTYLTETDKPGYAVETRKIVPPDGDVRDSVKAVVLDSVASQANRFELTLLDRVRGGVLALPVTSADFRAVDSLADLDRISDYEAPHRIFDAILRDSLDGDLLFRLGPTGRAITDATSRNAAALFHHSPITLLFGGWDSTGVKGGRGAKYERALTSEIVALDIEPGYKTASRIDSLGIELKAGTVYEADDSLGWTLDETEAVHENGKPKKFVRSKSDKPGRPSQINHGNVTPSIDVRTGGVTAARIDATTVLSFIQLRRLRFPTGVDGAPLSEGARRDAEVSARAALAALGLAAIVYGFDDGFDLRSRCVLVAETPLTFELIGRSGETRSFRLSADDATALVEAAAEAARSAGMPWRERELLLRPHDRLVNLVRRSREVAASAEAEEA